MNQTASTNSGPDLDALIILCSNNQGGAEMSMASVARGLQQKGLRVALVVYGRRTDLIQDTTNSGVEIIRLNAIRTLTIIRPLYKMIQERRPTTLITALTHTNIVSTLVAYIARRETRIIVTEHGQKCLDPNLLNGMEKFFLPKLAGLVYMLADEIVAVSNGLAGFIMDNILPWSRKKPVRVIYNPVVPTEQPKPAAPPHPWLTPEHPPVVISAGRLENDKKFSLLMRAFGRVARKRPCKLIILGEGSERKMLQTLITDIGMGEHILMPGFVHNVNDWLQNASVFVCSSLFEGFGNAIVEAMACGLTVVSTDCPYGPVEILDHGRYGRLVPSGDVELMATAIEDAIDHPMDRDAIRGRAAVFNEAQCIEGYANLMRNLHTTR
jgi:glycosyltransferase involved in cell wall biosynthesis